MRPASPIRSRSTAAAAGLLVATLLAIPLGSLAGLLLVVAQTGRGRIFALAALIAALAPLVALLVGRRNVRGGLAVLAAGVLIVGIPGLWLIATAPAGKAGTTARAFHVYHGGGFAAHALGNLLPEVDQLMLGFTLVPLVDPIMTQSSATRLKVWAAETYAELEQAPDFRSLGSVLPLAYAELRGEVKESQHAFVYLPPGLDRNKPAPVLVFFHGSGGNLKGYWWVLARAADRLGCVLVAPSFGLGNWRQPQTSLRLEGALVAVAKSVPLDSNQIHLAGLSNGGLAVSQLLAQAKRPFRSAVYISPVFDERELRAMTSSPAARKLPALVITGLLDDRVPPDYVRGNVEVLRRQGAMVELQLIDDADHFLMFSHRERLVDAIVEWWRRANPTP